MREASTTRPCVATATALVSHSRSVDLMESDDADLTGAKVVRRLELELRPLLLRWDPFGVGPECPPDEYDSYFGQVLSALRTYRTEEDPAQWVSAFSTSGPDPELNQRAARRTATDLLAWWREAQEWLPRGVSDGR